MCFLQPPPWSTFLIAFSAATAIVCLAAGRQFRRCGGRPFCPLTLLYHSLLYRVCTRNNTVLGIMIMLSGDRRCISYTRIRTSVTRERGADERALHITAVHGAFLPDDVAASIHLRRRSKAILETRKMWMREGVVVERPRLTVVSAPDARMTNHGNASA